MGIHGIPAYEDFVDRSASGQEDMLNAFSDLFAAPTARHVFAFALDSSDDQIFVRNFLRKLTPSAQGMAWVSSMDLSPGEQQFCLLLVSKGLAV